MKNRPKVVIDTNIFLNGWFDESKPSCGEIIDLIDNIKLQLMFSQDTIGELVYGAKNSARHNLDNVKDRIKTLEGIMTLFYYSTSVNTLSVKNETVKTNDEFDDMFIECAIAGKADYLITDDFKSGMHDLEIDGLIIVNSDDFMKLYNEKYKS